MRSPFFPPIYYPPPVPVNLLTTMVHTCAGCNTTFSTRSEKDRHGRKCPKTVYKLSCPFTGMHNVKMGKDSLFICYCKEGTCLKGFNEFRGLKEHFANSNTAWKAPVSENSSSQTCTNKLTIFTLRWKK